MGWGGEGWDGVWTVLPVFGGLADAFHRRVGSRSAHTGQPPAGALRALPVDLGCFRLARAQPSAAPLACRVVNESCFATNQCSFYDLLSPSKPLVGIEYCDAAVVRKPPLPTLPPPALARGPLEGQTVLPGLGPGCRRCSPGVPLPFFSESGCRRLRAVAAFRAMVAAMRGSKVAGLLPLAHQFTDTPPKPRHAPPVPCS